MTEILAKGAAVDPDMLQHMDELNLVWVQTWKKAVAAKSK